MQIAVTAQAYSKRAAHNSKQYLSTSHAVRTRFTQPRTSD